MEKSKRAFELDALRGLALFLMIAHHTMVDFRYILELDVFEFQESNWFIYILRPIFLCIFVVVSGICCQFSKNNLKRSLKLLLISLLLSIGMAAFSLVTDSEEYVFFNVLHLLTVGTFFYGLYALWEEKRAATKNGKTTYSTVGLVFIILAAAVLIYSQNLIFIYGDSVNSYWLLPLGFLPPNHIGMGDYLPILPWLGFFFIGVVIGRVAYGSKQTLFPGTPAPIRKLARPFQWFGRNSLLIYLVHQPILLAILFGLRYLGVW